MASFLSLSWCSHSKKVKHLNMVCVQWVGNITMCLVVSHNHNKTQQRDND